jgi:hypothetical protein
MRNGFLVTLTLLVGCVATPSVVENTAPLLVVTGVPISAERTNFHLDDCCENCLCHGLDVLRLSISNVVTLYGPQQAGQLQVSMLEGFTWTDRRKSGRHLFVLRRLNGDIATEGQMWYAVVEGDPIDSNQACTSQKIENYVSGQADYFSYEAWEDDGSYCYDVRTLERLLADES